MEQQSDMAPSRFQASMVGLPVVALGALMASLVTSDDWVPAALGGAVITLGLIRSWMWISHARRLRLTFDGNHVVVEDGGGTLLDVDADDIRKSEWVPPNMVLFSPNNDHATLLVHLTDQSIKEVKLWMPFQRQVESLQRMWRAHGLP